VADFDISPQSLRTSAAGLSDVIDRMATAINAAEAEIRGQGSPWGTGLVGSLIGQLYEGVHDAMMDQFQDNAEAMSEYAEGLDNSAAVLEDLETEIEAGFTDISAELGQTFVTRPLAPPGP
jgi:hypothetical protein